MLYKVTVLLEYLDHTFNFYKKLFLAEVYEEFFAKVYEKIWLMVASQTATNRKLVNKLPTKQVDVVLPLKTGHPAAITELITHA